LGNFITIKDFINQNRFSIDALKLFFLQTHYSQSIDFTWERIEEKQKAIHSILEFLSAVEKRRNNDQIVNYGCKKFTSVDEMRKEIDWYVDEFKKSMNDDFNMPNAVAILFEIVRYCNKIIYSDNYSKEHLKELTYAKDKILELGSILGLSLKSVEFMLTDKDKELIKRRDEYKLLKNFSEADKIRNELKSKGIVLRDNKDGSTTFERI
jgi:cysteinyl-tRNA synthetase